LDTELSNIPKLERKQCRQSYDTLSTSNHYFLYLLASTNHPLKTVVCVLRSAQDSLVPATDCNFTKRKELSRRAILDANMKVQSNISLLSIVLLLRSVCLGQSTGALQGTVTLELSGSPVHNVNVSILELKRAVLTKDDGRYEFSNVPPGRYTLVVQLDRMPDAVATVEISPGATATADFAVRLEPIKMQVTVTASGSEETTFDSIRSVEALGSIELAQKSPVSLGEALERPS
jgi:hypothetical protein